MKIQRFITTILPLVFCLCISCKKYNCECSFDSGAGPVVIYGKSNYIVKGITKSKAKQNCDKHSTTEDATVGKTNCSITD